MENIYISSAQSIYIHIPFCVKKCNYCAFTSFENHLIYEESYINALLNEISRFSSKKEIQTIYFGGGTPNLLKIKSLDKIINKLNSQFNISRNCEITMEFNPKISDLTYFKDVKTLGVNRISLGAQSFNDKILKILNRIHNSADTLYAVENIKKSGIENFSLDLMYGIFSQKLNDIEQDLIKLKQISPNHISTYGLKIEEGTPFYNFNTENLPDEDLCADMYLLICDFLKRFGYEHYEISNFAHSGFEAKHNLVYWENKEYFGFGLSAHGYLNKIRYKNKNNLAEYIKNPFEKEILSHNTQADILEEEIFLGLRLNSGIDLEKIKKEFNIDILKYKKEKIDAFISNGYVELNANNLSLSEKGFLISNYIISELLT